MEDEFEFRKCGGGHFVSFLGVKGVNRDVLMVLVRCGEARLKLVGRERGYAPLYTALLHLA